MAEIRFRFSIRDLFWLSLVVALAVGWWFDHDSVRRERERLQSLEAEVRAKSDDLDIRRESLKQLSERQGLK
jgi:hypothetical protein